MWTGPERMEVQRVPEQATAPGAVTLRPGAAGICGSEIEGYLGRMRNRIPPLVMGHEFAGEIVEVGAGVDPAWMGRSVAVNPLLPCQQCALCHAGFTNICPHRALIGIQHPGGFAELVSAPVENVVALPQGVSPAIGALAEPFANGVHAVRLGLELGPAAHTIIVGAGTIGLLVMEAALLAGAGRVAVVEPFGPRRAHAARLGAHAVYETSSQAEEAVRAETDGLGADLVIDAVGTSGTRQAAMGAVRPAGCVVALGLRDDESPLVFHHLVRNQITIRGSYAYTMDDYRQALAWLIEGKAGIGEAPTILPLEEGPEVFAELARGPSARVKYFLAP